jgi:hypothetical protein
LKQNKCGGLILYQTGGTYFSRGRRCGEVDIYGRLLRRFAYPIPPVWLTVMPVSPTVRTCGQFLHIHHGHQLTVLVVVIRVSYIRNCSGFAIRTDAAV